MKFFRFMLIPVLAFLFGCIINSNLVGLPKMEVTIINQSSHVLENAVAHFGSFDCGWGYVAITGNKGWIGFPHPITADVELQWDESGRHRIDKIDLRKIYPLGKDGELIFTVYDAEVKTTFVEKEFK